MPFRLTGLSLPRDDRVVAPGGVPLTLRVYQPVVWVRLAPRVGPPDPAAVTFPAVVDTGNNHSFLIPSSLFRAWVRLDPAELVTVHRVRAVDVELRCHALNVDLYRVRDGNPTDRVAGRLQTDRGVVIVPESLEHLFPRLPVIGVRCLRASRAVFTVDGSRATYSLRGPG